MKPQALPEISVVIPAWNEEGNLERLHEKLAAVLDPLRLSWELIVADDGSSDGTWPVVMRLNGLDTRVKGVRLSRNFGHQAALLAGLAHASGRAVISMDADHQHPPEVVPTLIDEWRRGTLIVHTIRIDGPEQGFLKRTSSRLFYRIFSALSGSTLEPGMADFRLLDRQVVDELLRFPEEGLFLRSLVQWVGFPSARVPYECGPRYSGMTKYSPRRMLKFAWTAVTSFSLVPLRAAVVTGAITSGVAFLAIVYAVGAKVLGFYTVPGWASILSILSFLFGMLFIFLGIIGEYIGRILIEVKQRPRFLVRERLGTEPVASRTDSGLRAARVAALPGDEPERE
jgi:dolichol-phosphate mannosyltransferase